MQRALAPLLSCLALAGLAACGPSADAPDDARPDVLLVVIDTLRADRLSCYGHERPTSPRIDALAASGTLFEDATAQAPWTKPSMASMLTGRYLTTYRDVYEEQAKTLAEAFREAGYRTLGTTGNVLLSRAEGFDRGFDHYDDTKLERGEIGRRADELLTDLWEPLERALEPEANGVRPPLFLYVHVMDPHHPYRTHPEFDAELPRGPQGADEPTDWQRETFAALGPEPPEDDPDWRQSWSRIEVGKRRYDQEVRYTDLHVGRLVDRLAELGVGERLLFALAADHGECLWDHPTPSELASLAESAPDEFFYRDHGKMLHRELLATPLVLAGAGVPAGVRVAEPVENIDLYPTLLELAGIPLPSGLHGRSLVPLMHGRADEGPGDLFANVRGATSVRESSSGWKLVLPDPDDPAFGVDLALYSLREDPFETEDQSAKHPEVVERLTAKIEAWREAHPTESSIRRRAQETIDDMRALGYAHEADAAEERE